MRIGALLAGRYRLDAFLGAGSMGQVWRAFDERLERPVAVKVIDLASATGPTSRARFEREALAAARLSHPHIVTTYDGGVDGDHAYLVMEIAGGQTLAELIAGGPLPIGQVARIGAAVAGALAATHRIGVVHRDIKPGNIMVDGDQVKVLDFGIAQLASETTTLTGTHAAIGTAAYMSPEQALGQRVGPASDIYALGCVLLAMLTGRPPFAGDHAVAVAQQQVSGTPPRAKTLRRDVPAGLDALVASMLEKDAAARPDATQVASVLSSFAAPGALPTAPLGRFGRPRAAAASPAVSASVGIEDAPTALLSNRAGGRRSAQPVTTTAPAAARGRGSAATGTERSSPRGATSPRTSAQRTSAQRSSSRPQAASQRTTVMPTATAVMPPRPAPAPPFSARRLDAAGATPAPGRLGRPTRKPWFRRGLGLVIKLMVALVVVGVLWTLGARALAQASGVSLPGLPSIALPNLLPDAPAGQSNPNPAAQVDQQALDTAIAAVSKALNQWDPASTKESKAKDKLQNAWAGASDKIASGKDAQAQLDAFASKVQDARDAGTLPLGTYAAVQLSLKALDALV